MGERKLFYRQLSLGEVRPPLYKGPLWPDLRYVALTRELIDGDQFYQDNFFNSLISPELFDIQFFWQQEFLKTSACPVQHLSYKKEYISYLFKLLSISYLYEGLKIYQRDMYRLGLNQQLCPITWDDLFKECTPSHIEMERFLTRSKAHMSRLRDWSGIQRISHSQLETWIKNLGQQSLDSENLSISQMRLLLRCQQDPKQCQSLSKESVEQLFAQSCQQDRQEILKLCNMKDRYFGLSELEKMKDIIINGHALSSINRTGRAEACVRIYVSLYRSQEIVPSYVNYLFSAIYDHMRVSGRVYVEGELFLPGSLRHFDQRGVELAIFKPIIEDVPVVGEVEVEEVVTVEKPAAPAVPERISFRIRPVPEKEVEEVEEVPSISHFASIVKKVGETGESQGLDMNLFKEDFQFSQRMTEALETPLSAYQTRDALMDMRQYDLLGTQSEPMRLIFLKYLIDFDHHQGLFNIQDIIGERFWILNDIDRDPVPVKIKLQNNASTHHRWQITVMAQKEGP